MSKPDWSFRILCAAALAAGADRFGGKVHEANGTGWVAFFSIVAVALAFFAVKVLYKGVR